MPFLSSSTRARVKWSPQAGVDIGSKYLHGELGRLSNLWKGATPPMRPTANNPLPADLLAPTSPGTRRPQVQATLGGTTAIHCKFPAKSQRHAPTASRS